jgi:hypothetical protein
MIKMKLIGGTAPDALSTVTLPYLKLDVCRDGAAADWMNGNGNVEVFFACDSGELELENRAMCVRFTPRIDEMKDAVVRPDALAELLVNADPFRRPLTGLARLRCAMKKPFCVSAPRKVVSG